MTKPIAFLFVFLAACSSAPPEIDPGAGGSSGAGSDAEMMGGAGGASLGSGGALPEMTGGSGGLVPPEPDGSAGVAGSAGGLSGSGGVSAAGGSAGAGTGGAIGSAGAGGSSGPMLCDGWKAYNVSPHGTIKVSGGSFWLTMQASNPGAIACSAEPWTTKNPTGFQTSFCFVDPSATQSIRFWIALAPNSRATVTVTAAPPGGVGFCP